MNLPTPGERHITNPDAVHQPPAWSGEDELAALSDLATVTKLEKQLAAMTARRDFWRWATKALWERKVLEFGELAALARKHLPPK